MIYFIINRYYVVDSDYRNFIFIDGKVGFFCKYYLLSYDLSYYKLL